MEPVDDVGLVDHLEIRTAQAGLLRDLSKGAVDDPIALGNQR